MLYTILVQANSVDPMALFLTDCIITKLQAHRSRHEIWTWSTGEKTACIVCACLQLHAHIHAGKDMHKHVQKNMHPHIHMKSRTQSYGFHTQTHTHACTHKHAHTHTHTHTMSRCNLTTLIKIIKNKAQCQNLYHQPLHCLPSRFIHVLHFKHHIH